jgi:2Fe-2S ferredoxin
MNVMPVIHFIEHDGTRHDVEADQGVSVMRAALDNGVPGIVGDCGGFLSCATCHTYIADEWAGRLPPPSEEELVMVDGALDVRPTSRLACQIEINAELDGIVVHIPEAQS